MSAPRVFLVDDHRLFEKLFRVISLTEKRGYRQVEILLKHPIVRQDAGLIKIFRIVEQDEPSHWAPYDGWLRRNAKRPPRWWERAIDGFIHSELLLLKLPILFLNVGLRRRGDWADAKEPAHSCRPMLPWPPGCHGIGVSRRDGCSMADALKVRIREDLNAARRERDRLRTTVLTTVLSEIRNREIYERNPFAPLYDLSRTRSVLGASPRYDARDATGATLTAMALTARACDYIVDQFRQGSL